ncbi:putative D,D-dipeptide transport system permease protein DdpC [Marinomonas spartinae]|uniref:Putative D,D-dipeptide transport system permease protein DdpC n=1 Tax=Marinomonas spartinae TaxID=1792290 RepID=A0A1A8TC23_9GAMM|nr:ABC transporter permease [Marinomonas spartinae]SBS29747.1 putative D,D-dipeptide transport system permease protein DdpC [Marinomonas spartinae]
MMVSLLKHATLGQKCGGLLLLVLLVFALFGNALAPNDGAYQDLDAILAPPSGTHWLGTDHFGRSMVARMADAIRLSFMLGVLCVATSSIIGVSLGVWAAWSGKKVDAVLNVFVNIILALPGLVIVLLLAAIVPGSFFVLYLAISLVQWVEYLRVVRAITKMTVDSPAMQSSQMMGFGRWYLFKRHIWPAIAPSVFTLATFGCATAILTMASLGFVYVGMQPPLAELGLMMVELFPYYSDAPWLLAEPLIAIALLVLGFHLLGRKSS